MAERAEMIDEAAADWVARRDRGDWTAADEAEFERWLAASTRNRVAWLRLNAAWEQADQLGAATAPHRRRPVRWAAAAAIAATLLAGIFVAAEYGPRSYATTVGGSRAEMLEDGSRLELNTDSRVSLRGDEGRQVRLDRGEAFFSVARAGDPFTVQAGDYTVTAAKGAFSIHRDGDRITVAVEQGQVAVHRRGLAAEPVICTAGSVVEARPEAIRLVSAPAQVDRVLSWRRGLVTFDDSRLADVVAEFNRYNRTKLVITDPALAEARIGGAFRPTNLEAFVSVLSEDAEVTAVREDGRILLSRG